jgi:preprotein translocase subunit SecE
MIPYKGYLIGAL